ncbi:MAG TPA: hypothetical protein VM716_02120, partial [Gemmatimonadales bacterium]|nr:hypothetical protein [Gemmatimonadales bacterium]
NPGSTDTTHGSGESHDPARQFTIASTADLSGNLSLDGALRYVGRIDNQAVPAYAELDARVTWRPGARWSVSVVGQNLLHDHHAEFGSPARQRGIRRGAYGSLEWQF